jgi:tRNA G18 (ribose-2'-O)-methylase SpoU
LQEQRPLATPITITDPDDLRIAPFAALRERDLVGRQGRFIAEGEVVLQVLLGADRFDIETILVSERVAAAGRDWFSRVPPDVPVLIAGDDIIARVCGFHVHRGILAMARHKRVSDAAALLADLPESALAVACVGIANHDNMGGIFRNAAAFSAAAVLCDATCCDPLYRKAIRVSVGGVFTVPFARGGTAEDIVAALDGAGFRIFALSPSGETALHELPLQDRASAARTALILGTEGTGLPPGLLAKLMTVRIGMAASFDSLNVGTSAGIALHHFFNRLNRPFPQ